jgi:AcrR family transcriptional regulator
MDRRQRKSREAIFSAFNNLLTQKKYADITVQDIIDRADVGRTTFYAHFDTKDALLEEMCTELFDHVVSDHDEAEDTHDFSGEENDTESIITHILYHLRDNQKNMLGIFNGESGDMFFRFFKRYLIKVFEAELKGEIKQADVPDDYLYHIISCVFVDTLNWWIKNGMKQTPEEVERYFRNVMSAVIS